MTNEVNRAVRKWNATKDRCEEIIGRRKDRLMDELDPILDALLGSGRRDPLDIAWFGRTGLVLQFVGRQSGGPYHSEATIPTEVMNAPDPVEAARAYREAQQAALAREQLNRELVDLQRRADRLGVEIVVKSK